MPPPPALPVIPPPCAGAQCWLGARFRQRLAAAIDIAQSAAGGSAALDARIDAALHDRAATPAGAPAISWSTDLTAVLHLVPAEFDVSMGHRDGICWAWMQPNDGWVPDAHEARHDHPLGSGLIVAYTIPLALVCAAMKLRVRWDGRGAPAA